MTEKGTTGINSILKVLGLLIIISVLLPSTRIVFSFKPDLPLLLIASLLLIRERKVARLPIIVHLKVLGAMLFACMLFSDNVGNFSLGVLGKLFIIPTEYMQVLSRILVFYLFAYLGYYSIISPRLFNKVVSIVFIIALSWAMLQITDFSFVKAISIKFYALTSLQVNVLESAKTRVFGTAGNAITWGGLSALIFYFFFFLRKNGNKAIRIVGIVMSLASVIYSSSRAALFALVLSFILIQLIIPFYKKKGPVLLLTLARNLILTIIGSATLLGAALMFMPERVLMIATRIENTEEDLTEEGRGGQLAYFIDLFSGHNEYYLFGIGKQSLDSLSFMEMEPFFLLFAYGVVGVILHYAMLVILLKNASRLRWFHYDGYFFIIALTLFYVIFSFGFFFFREVISGLPFWWLCGYLIGTMFKAKHHLQAMAQSSILTTK